MRFIFSVLLKRHHSQIRSILILKVIVVILRELIFFENIVEVLFSGILDLEDVGWRIFWVVEAELDSINPPHEGGLAIVFLPWSSNFPGQNER
jgi:hypothetical protein